MPKLNRWKRFRTPALIVGSIVATAVVSGAAGATAAVHYVILGAKNSTTAATYINNSAGTPLALNSKTGYAPLAVGSSVQVKKLNADYVDGLHASSFARTTGKTGVIAEAADGTTGTATCPKGTVLTGGGGLAEDGLDYSGPSLDVANSWETIGYNNTYTFAVCYNPTGAVPGALSATAASKLASQLKATAKPTATATGTMSLPPSPRPTPTLSPPGQG